MRALTLFTPRLNKKQTLMTGILLKKRESSNFSSNMATGILGELYKVDMKKLIGDEEPDDKL